MNIRVPLGGGLTLELGDETGHRSPVGDGETGADYPTARLQKGLLLFADTESLAEEGVGFGVPVLKQGVRTVFPGRMEATWRSDGEAWEVSARYEMDLVERLAKGARVVDSRALYGAKDALAAVHRHVPGLRGPLGAVSAALRRAFGWETTYARTASSGVVVVTHRVLPAGGLGDGGAGCDIGGGEAGGARRDETGGARVTTTADLTGIVATGITEIVLMNEQGARCFERYEDSGGRVLCGADIGTWDEVTDARASFVCPGRRTTFSLGQVPGSRLYRGRELVGSRLAWAGFGYSLPSAARSFTCELTIARTP